MWLFLALSQPPPAPIEVVQTLPGGMTGLYLALGLAVVTLFQVIITAALNGWTSAKKEARDAERAIAAAKAAAEIKSAEKEEDWRRQDAVADRVAAAAAKTAEAAALLVESNKAVATQTKAEAERVQAQLHVIDMQGKAIHTLVNSDMTQARTNERDSTVLQLIALKRVQALTATIKQSPAQQDAEAKAITRAEKRIEELNLILAEREAAQRIVDAEAAADKQPSAAKAIEALKDKLDENTAATDHNTAVTQAVAQTTKDEPQPVVVVNDPLVVADKADK